MSVKIIESESEFDKIISEQPTVVHFWAEWCEPCKHFETVLQTLAETFQTLQFSQIDAEKFSNISEKSGIESVPTFILYKDGNEYSRVVGANNMELNKQVSSLSKATGNSEENLNARLKHLTSRSPVMLFMKGSPDGPRCGFSRKMVDILRSNSVEFDYFDILTDEDVRQGLKKYSDWPTYPQLYSKGELIGGLDVVRELHDDGSLMDEINM
eukprot:gb/GECH01013296.1/.p1 GENE.gb/GECH01013296.1/~~gb/GECH01013296.1/.p1  ORF type:complete len:212 (+),score=52.26 gb/GECH01013296.1/:1-636(+)